MTMNLSRVAHAFARPDIEPGHIVVDLDGKCMSSMSIETAHDLLASIGHAIVQREIEDTLEAEKRAEKEKVMSLDDCLVQLVGITPDESWN